MAGKRTSASLTVDEVARLKNEGLNGKSKSSSSSPSSSSGYFSTVFPPAAFTVMAKDLAESDLHWTLNKQRTESNVGSVQRMSADNKKKGSPSKSSKEGIYPTESAELPYFGSSVHYGGRDFYTTSQAISTSVNSANHYERKTSGGDESGNSDIATRGEWWQGSLYY